MAMLGLFWMACVEKACRKQGKEGMMRLFRGHTHIEAFGGDGMGWMVFAASVLPFLCRCGKLL
jgi:hypothetical protein